MGLQTIIEQEQEYRGSSEEVLANVRDQFGGLGKTSFVTSVLEDLASKEQDPEKRALYGQLASINKQGTEQAERHTYTDALTGLWNRGYFDSELERNVSRVRKNSVRFKTQENYSLSLIMIDIDHFKQYNDNFGHQEGDRVLREVSDTIKKYSSKGDIVCRYGGEEIAVIAPETNLKGAETYVERLRSKIEEETGVTVSIGVANYTQNVKDHYTIDQGRPIFSKKTNDVMNELIEKADNALYKSKENGRNKYTMCTEVYNLKEYAA